MKKVCSLFLMLVLSACSTDYILIDEDSPFEESYYGESYGDSEAYSREGNYIRRTPSVRKMTANDVFVVEEGADFVTYQYRSVVVDEVSPLATMYCADVGGGRSSYLREVVMYHNGFMRATFDCVNLAI